VTVPAVQGIGQMPVRDAEVDISVSINGVKATLSGVTDPNGKYAIVDTNGSLPAELPANAVVTGVAKAAAPGTVPYEVDNPGAYPKAAYTSAAFNPITVLSPCTGYNNYNCSIPADSVFGANTAKAFQIYTVMYTYYHFATAGLGASLTDHLVVNYPAPSGIYWDQFTPGNIAPATIDFMLRAPFSYPDVIGHEFGHYVSSEAGFYPTLAPPSHEHQPGYNWRYYNPPTHGSGSLQPLTLPLQQAAFQEGWADYFTVAGASAAVAAATNSAIAAATGIQKTILLGEQATLKGWQGLATEVGTNHFFGFPGGAGAGWSLDNPTQAGHAGRGEDDEASVARILWALATNTTYRATAAGGATGAGHRALFSLLVAAPVRTLSELWNKLPVAAAPLSTKNTFAQLFQDNGVSPIAKSQSVVTIGGINQEALVFQVPLLDNDRTDPSPNPPGNDQLRAFDAVQLNFYAGPGDTAYGPPARISIILPSVGAPGLTRVVGGAGDPYQTWTYTVSAADLASVVAELAKRPGWDDSTVYWDVGGACSTGENNSGTGPYLSTWQTFRVAPINAKAKRVSVVEGTAYGGLVATFTDPDGPGNASDYTATIRWADPAGGTSPGDVVPVDPNDPSQGFDVYVDADAAHAYAEEGTYAFSVSIYSIYDESAPLAVVDAPATVGDAALSVTGYTGLTATEGAAFTGAVASFADDAPEDVAQGDYTATINWDDGTTSLGTVSPPGYGSDTFVVAGSHTYAAPGAYDVGVTVSDVGGSTASVTTKGAMTVGYGELSAWGDYLPVDYGTAFTGGPVATFINLGGSDPASAYTATIYWPGGSTSAGTIAGTGVPGQYSVSADGGSHILSGSVRVDITETDTSVQTTTASVYAWPGNDDDMTPMEVPIAATQGQAFSGTVAAFTDPNPAGTFSATITWPDKSTSPGTVTQDSASGIYEVSAASGSSYTFTGPGTSSEVSVAVKETVGNQVVNTVCPWGLATVGPAALTATGYGGPTATEGAEFSGVVATFPVEPGTGIGGSGAPSGYSAATITWEDGHTSAGTIVYDNNSGEWDVVGSYTYAEPGTYDISVKIDDAGGETTAASTMTVGDAALTATPVTVTAEEGQEFSGTVATFTDADPAGVSADYTATINWGDGSTHSSGFVQPNGLGGFTVTGSHTYAEAGTYGNVSVTITDNDGDPSTTGGATATAYPAVTVTDVPLAAVGQ
jgi:hypothetical protein